MSYLLDTGVWLWSIDAVDKISHRGFEILSNGRKEVYFSAASAWELTIKYSLGKLRLPAAPTECIPAFATKQGLRLLSVTQSHAVKVYDLPPHHRDPFDRLIIAQAMVEKMTILTADRVFGKYEVEIVWCGK